MVGVRRAVLAAFGLVLVPTSPAVAQTYPPSTNSWVYDFAGAISAADDLKELERTMGGA